MSLIASSDGGVFCFGKNVACVASVPVRVKCSVSRASEDSVSRASEDSGRARALAPIFAGPESSLAWERLLRRLGRTEMLREYQ